MTKFLIFLLLIFVSLALKANDKIQITSDNLTLNKKDLSATFEGNVRVFFEDQAVSTNKLIIYYSDLGPKREIVKIIFPTKIKAIKNYKNGVIDVVVADSGEFDNLAKKLTLIGNVQMQKDDNVLVTDKMVYSAKLKSIESKSNAK
jgi:lipopolysaccharide export system protein LptA